MGETLMDREILSPSSRIHAHNGYFDFIGATVKDVSVGYTFANFNDLEFLQAQADQVICK